MQIRKLRRDIELMKAQQKVDVRQIAREVLREEQ